MAADPLGGDPRDSPSPSIHTPTPPRSLTSSIPPKRKPVLDSAYFSNPNKFCSSLRPSDPPSKRTRSQKDNVYMELHQSTCLNLNTSDNSDSDLWILPDFEDWEYDDASPLTHPRDQKARINLEAGQDTQSALSGQNEWIPFVQRAASSNRERLRRRLEGDGWDFVGGKYGHTNMEDWPDTGSASEESVDEEFDVVVLLPQISVS